MRRTVNRAVALSMLAFGAAVAAPAAALAQTLDLDGVRAGPAIPGDNAASELLRVLDAEKRELDLQAARLAGEAKLRAESKARLRQVAMILLQQGAVRPWNQSGPVVFGLRLANAMSRLDRAVDAAGDGRRLADDTALAAADARAAADALRALNAIPLDELRSALGAGSASPAVLARALSRVLAPLATVLKLTEGTTLGDPWPTMPKADATGGDRAQASASASAKQFDAASANAAIDGMDAGPAREAARAVLAAAAKDPIADASLLRTLATAIEAQAWSRSVRGASKVPAIDASVLDAMDRRTTGALERLASALNAQPADAAAVDAVVAQMDALRPSIDAARAMLAMRGEPWVNDAAKQALADACGALCAAELPDASAERSRARVAARIVEACEAARLLSRAEAADAPRDLKEIARMLDRDARTSVRALPSAFADMARDTARAADPDALSGLSRVTTLADDRARLVALQGLIDRVGGVQPKAGRGFAAVAKRLARMLLDPIKRSDAQRAFAAIESQAAAALPFPFEDDLNRATARAEALTGGNSRRVLETAAAVRVAWAESLASGGLAGPDAQRLDLVSRFCAALRDVAQLTAPITREEGDRLSTWGGWAARRALLAPAAVDLDARAILASRSLIAAGPNGDLTAFGRDLIALEQDLPIVRLAARLERTLAPSLQDDPDSVAAMLAPVLRAPAPDAALAREWDRLLTLNRALLEAEFARRTADLAYRKALAEYIAALAGDIETAAFGARPTVGAVSGLVEMPADEPTDRVRRSTDRPRAR
jgi:hypothetical protein